MLAIAPLKGLLVSIHSNSINIVRLRRGLFAHSAPEVIVCVSVVVSSWQTWLWFEAKVCDEHYQPGPQVHNCYNVVSAKLDLYLVPVCLSVISM